MYCICVIFHIHCAEKILQFFNSGQKKTMQQIQ